MSEVSVTHSKGKAVDSFRVERKPLDCYVAFFRRDNSPFWSVATYWEPSKRYATTMPPMYSGAGEAAEAARSVLGSEPGEIVVIHCKQ